MTDIQWNDAALRDLLQGMDGPVGKWLMEKSLEMTAVAQAGAPIQKPKNFSWGKNSTSYMPRSFGYLKSSVKPHMGYTQSGTLYGGVNAAYGPTLFLEEGGGRHDHAERIPFMSTALYSVTIE